MLWLQNNFNILRDFKTDISERCRDIQRLIFRSFLILGSSRDTALQR